ncbi:hypothetical protein [Marinimicrococcus flavescens]|uniref:Uncharacterized protein n=1 Tax=Marinimicrococcus flavescens TaxID=3031815 RepID=A0AAP3XRF0_9PROT|nr:hypothetical protein [Marinimicrococcus flavescens]
MSDEQASGGAVPGQAGKGGAARDERAARLAAQLRENLKRRKAQQRGRAERPDPVPEEGRDSADC